MKIRNKSDEDVKFNIDLIQDEVSKSNVKISTELLEAFAAFGDGKTGEEIREESPAAYKEYMKVLGEIAKRQRTEKIETKERIQSKKNTLITHRKITPALEESAKERLYQIRSKLLAGDLESKKKELLIQEFTKKFNSLYTGTKIEDEKGMTFNYKGVNVSQKRFYFEGVDAQGRKEFLTVKMREGAVYAEKGMPDYQEPIVLHEEAEHQIEDMFDYLSATPQNKPQQSTEQLKFNMV